MFKLRTLLSCESDFLVSRWKSLTITLLLPVLVLLLLDRESTVHPVRLLVAGAPSTVGEQPDIDRLILILRESATLSVSTEPQVAVDPMSRMARGHFDLLLNYEGRGRKELSIYTAETDPLKLANLEQIGAGILRASAVISARLVAQERNKQSEILLNKLKQEQPTHEDIYDTIALLQMREPLFQEVWWTQPALYEDLFMVGTFPVDPLFEYFPQAADPRVSPLPGFISILLSVFPFLMMLARGREIEPSVQVSSWSEAATLVFAKSIVACAITLVSFLITLIVAESLFGIFIKAGIFRMILILVPALLASAFLGLGASKLVHSSLAIATMSMAYVILILLLGGSIIPLDERPWLVQQAAQLVPSTVLQPVLTGWIFGARFTWSILRPLGWLTLQSILYGAFAMFALRRPTLQLPSVVGQVASGAH